MIFLQGVIYYFTFLTKIFFWAQKFYNYSKLNLFCIGPIKHAAKTKLSINLIELWHLCCSLVQNDSKYVKGDLQGRNKIQHTIQIAHIN